MNNPVGSTSRGRSIALRFLLPALLLGVGVAVTVFAMLTFGESDQPISLGFDDEVVAAPSIACDDRCKMESASAADGPVVPPSLTNDLAVSRADGASLTLDVLANDRDPSGSRLTILDASLLTGEGSVDISGDGSTIEFQPAHAASGPWALSYTAGNERGGTASADVSISDGNRPPLPAPDFITVLADEVLEIDPLVNDEDEVEPLTLTTADTDDGPLEIIDGRRINFRAPHEVGTITINYTIQDVTGKAAASTVTVTVKPWDPVALDDIAEVEEDSDVAIDVLANDGPELADLDPTTLIVLDATLGVATTSSDAIRFVPAANATGTALITYQVCTIHHVCDMATVQVEILPVNDVPSFDVLGDITVKADAGPQSATWATNVSAGPGESEPVRFSVTTDRPDLFGDAPTISPQGLLEYAPNPARQGVATLTVRLIDSEGASAVRTLSIRVLDPGPKPENEG